MQRQRAPSGCSEKNCSAPDLPGHSVLCFRNRRRAVGTKGHFGVLRGNAAGCASGEPRRQPMAGTGALPEDSRASSPASNPSGQRREAERPRGGGALRPPSVFSTEGTAGLLPLGRRPRTWGPITLEKGTRQDKMEANSNLSVSQISGKQPLGADLSLTLGREK